MAFANCTAGCLFKLLYACTGSSHMLSGTCTSVYAWLIIAARNFVPKKTGVIVTPPLNSCLFPLEFHTSLKLFIYSLVPTITSLEFTESSRIHLTGLGCLCGDWWDSP